MDGKAGELYRVVLPLTPDWWKEVPSGPVGPTTGPYLERTGAGFMPEIGQMPFGENWDGEEVKSTAKSNATRSSAQSRQSARSAKSTNTEVKSTTGSEETALDTSDPPRAHDISGTLAYQFACERMNTTLSKRYGKCLRTGRAINMNYYGMGPKGIKALAYPLTINATCTVLNLTGNIMDEEAFEFLITVLKENVSIRDVDLSATKIGRFGPTALADLIVTKDNFQILNLSDNEFTDKDGVTLAQALEENRGLINVNLSGNEFSVVSGNAFRSYISENTFVKSLNLSWNHLRMEGAIAIAKGMKENVSLLKLNLSWNGFEDAGAVLIAEALALNPDLEELDLTCNRIGAEGFLAIVNALKKNDSLKRLIVGRNLIPEEAVREAFAVIIATPTCVLELLDFTDIMFSSTFPKLIEHMQETRPNFECPWGYADEYGRRKAHELDTFEAFEFLHAYTKKHNINLAELFAKFDVDGSMSVTYDEFREGIDEAGIPLTGRQINDLIVVLDRDGDGEIDFSELVLGTADHEEEKRALTG